jgi:2'-5' RNA ligase
MSKRSRRPPKVRPPSHDAIEAPWRLFIAIPLPEEARALVASVITDLTTNDWPVRWVAPEIAHLTLHFLGNTNPDRAELLRLALTETISQHSAFTLRTDGLGAFPQIRRPRVLWLGLDGQIQALESLHREIGEALHGLSFPVEAGKLNPHITLGRVRDNPPADFGLEVEQRFADIASRIALTPTPIAVDEVLLIRSFLGKGGARHETVASYPLSR